MNVTFNKFNIVNENRNIRSAGIYFDTECNLYIQSDIETINKFNISILYKINIINTSILFKVIYIKKDNNNNNNFIIFSRIISNDSELLKNIPENTSIEITEFIPFNIKYQVSKNNKLVNTIPDEKDIKNSWDFLEL